MVIKGQNVTAYSKYHGHVDGKLISCTCDESAYELTVKIMDKIENIWVYANDIIKVEEA